MQADSDDEIEIDIDQLSTEVLWKLDRYTKNIVQKVRKKTVQKGPGAQGGAKPGAASQPAAAAAASEPQPYNGGTAKAGQNGSSSSSSGR